MVGSLGFSIYTITSPADRDNFLLSNSDSFISFSCLIALARTSSATLNRCGESRHPCLIPDVRGKANQPFTLEDDISCRLRIYMAFIMLRYVPSMPNLKVFIMNRCRILLNAFSISIEMII